MRPGVLPALGAIALTLGASFQDEGDRDVDELLDELIEQTNQLESFRATYVNGGGETVFELFYEAPDRARIRLTLGEEDEVVEWFLVEGVLCMRQGDEQVRGDVGPSMTAYNPLREALQETFPVMPPLEPIEVFPVGIQLWIGPDAETGKARMQTSVNMRRGINPCAWLQSLKDSPESPWIEGDEILCTPADDIRVRASVSSGFLTLLEYEDLEGKARVLRLENLELDGELPADTFELPDPTVTNTEEAFTDRQWKDQAFHQARAMTYNTIARSLEEEEGDADDSDLVSVFELLYEIYLEEYPEVLEGYLSQVERLGDWLVEQDASEKSAEDLRGMAGTQHWLDQLEQAFDQLRESYDGHEVPPLEVEVPGADVLMDIERAAAITTNERVVFDPVLEAVDELLESCAGR